jgi:hypothetical protein
MRGEGEEDGEEKGAASAMIVGRDMEEKEEGE